MARLPISCVKYRQTDVAPASATPPSFRCTRRLAGAGGLRESSLFGQHPLPMDASLTAARAVRKNWTVWAGRILSALPVLLMIFSAIMKLMHSPQVVEGFTAMGVRPELINVFAIVELACVALYLIPPTAVLGAVLIAAYLGGAVLAHLIGRQPVWTPILTAVVAWLGLYLREPRVRALFPLQK